MSETGRRPTREEEAELVAGCKQGDPQAWQRLFEQYRPDTWRILCRVLGPADELEDLVQKVFLKVYRSLDKFEGRSRFTTWLYRICVHVAMDHLRTIKRRREVPDDESGRQLADPTADPAASLAQKDAARCIQKALAHLREDKRTVIVLHDLMEISTEEIATDLGIPAATVRTRLFYGRRELARHIHRQKAGER